MLKYKVMMLLVRLELSICFISLSNGDNRGAGKREQDFPKSSGFGDRRLANNNKSM